VEREKATDVEAEAAECPTCLAQSAPAASQHAEISARVAAGVGMAAGGGVRGRRDQSGHRRGWELSRLESEGREREREQRSLSERVCYCALEEEEGKYEIFLCYLLVIYYYDI